MLVVGADDGTSADDVRDTGHDAPGCVQARAVVEVGSVVRVFARCDGAVGLAGGFVDGSVAVVGGAVAVV